MRTARQATIRTATTTMCPAVRATLRRLGPAMICAAAVACSKPAGTLGPALQPPIPLAAARAAFADAAGLCAADHGALWGVSLCGPLMIVDRETRFLVANQADELGKLQPQDGVFAGTLPADETIANTAVTWAGVRWVQLGWPLPADRAQRAILVMHEQFHRIADQAGIPSLIAGDNAHLDTAAGRTLLQLEWRALAAALTAAADPARRAAIADALAFRQARRMSSPDAAGNEDALELNEGLAEYTGIVAGARDPAACQAAAVHDLTVHVDDPSFVRSFAYATGPAYGLLLDRYAPTWRTAIARTPSLSAALASAVGSATPGPATPAELDAIAARYDGAALRQHEQSREAERTQQLARYRQQLVDGSVLRLPFRHMKIEFDPRNVVPLDALGSVYPRLRVVDDWGVLDVTGGALLAADFAAVTVAAPPASPPASAAANQTGPGWTLALTAGWHLVPGERAGDFQLAPPSARPSR